MTKEQLQILLALQPPRTQVHFTYVGYYGEVDGWIGNLSELPYIYGINELIKLDECDPRYHDMLVRYRLLKSP